MRLSNDTWREVEDACREEFQELDVRIRDIEETFEERVTAVGRELGCLEEALVKARWTISALEAQVEELEERIEVLEGQGA